MQHIHEGELHAYLDGALDQLGSDRSAAVRAHLAACQACRERLEEERALLDASSSILEEDVPSLGEIPPFEEIRARAEARAAGGGGGAAHENAATTDFQRSKPSRWLPSGAWGLGWAASIALALGVGWYGRGFQPQRELALQSSAVDEVAAMEEAANEDADRRGFRSDAGDEPPVRSEDRQRGVEAPTPSRELGALRDAQEQESSAVSAEGKVVGGAIEQEAPAESALAADLPQAPVVLADEAAERMGSDFGVEADASQASPGSSLTVPDFPVLSIQPDGAVPGQPGLRILQLLPQGDTLELRYFGLLIDAGGGRPLGTRLSGAVPRIALRELPTPPLKEGWSQVIQARGGGWLVARAPTEQKFLETIIQWIR